MKKKSTMIIAILIMSIGFAAISTTLIINGSARVSENTEDFSVIFTSVSLDGQDVYANVIDDTKKIITFETSELKALNQTSVLNYEVTNNSANYDAEVQVNCKVKDNATAKYTSIKNELEGNATVVKAKETLNGTLTVTLNKTATEEVKVEYVCELTFNAIERDELGKKTSYTLTKAENNTSEFAELGDTINVGNEKFYVISNNNHKVAALAYYNLNVGENLAEGTSGVQNENAKGWYSGGTNPFLGGVAFSNTNGWPNSNDENIILKSYPGAVNSALYDESNGYEKYIQKLGLNATTRLILKSELLELGCKINNHSCVSSGHDWLYSSSYWVGTSASIDVSNVWRIDSNGGLYSNYYYGAGAYGVRPVIEFVEEI